MEYSRGKLKAEGKTKKIWEACKSEQLLAVIEDFVIIENKEDITAFDDPKFTKKFATKARCATTTTCKVFGLLKASGIPVAYVEQISPTEFVALNCVMIPLEVVARRYAVGSYLKRHPELAKEGQPYRFHRLVTEFFLKTTKGSLKTADGEIVVEGLDPQKGEEDPFIINPLEEKWKLYHSKKPKWDSGSDLARTVDAGKIVPSVGAMFFNPMEAMKEMDNLMRETFLVLEGAWAILGLRLIDMKIEFGVDVNGNLVVADVIDNDSWRLRTSDWQELSKEAFRQGEELNEVERKYGIVADLANNFRIPSQVIVIWRGSDKDSSPAQNVKTDGLNFEEVVLSGHKSPGRCLEKLEEILARYPEGGVFIVKVGMSNGLGPIIAARTSWPVIAIPASVKDFPDDVWSSLRMPSQVPLQVVVSDDNAIKCAMNILASKNPAIYMQRQKSIEEMDN
ncbi:MAG: phosphoribosylaminoimidazolesuccinocarboxamide synthase [Minisyncoccia bacterium]